LQALEVTVVCVAELHQNLNLLNGRTLLWQTVTQFFDLSVYQGCAAGLLLAGCSQMCHFTSQGNIRAMLGSLEHVLWEGSSWKPVGMADLLEAPQVSYCTVKFHYKHEST